MGASWPALSPLRQAVFSVVPVKLKLMEGVLVLTRGCVTRLAMHGNSGLGFTVGDQIVASTPSFSLLSHCPPMALGRKLPKWVKPDRVKPRC